ncbi:MAG TPA: hypothetical protein VGM23_06780 [Armatimonadota bacterium]|jgi:hypothetical protein
MRWLYVMAIVGLIGGLAGCGGGGGNGDQPLTARGNMLVVSYFDWLITTPPPQPQGQEFYQVSASLWMPQTAPLLSGLTLHMPYTVISPILTGPALLSPTSGTNELGVPLYVYWGSATVAPTGQPTIVAPGAYCPGYIRPTESLYLYSGTNDLDSPVSVSGSYNLVGGSGYTRTWTVPDGQQMPAAVSITQPMAPVANTLQPIHIAWNAVPNVSGYLVNVEADLKDKDKNVIRHIAWTSAPQAAFFDTVFDLSDLLLPATTLSVDVPAGIFRGCDAIQVDILAQAAPYVDQTQQPALRIVNASMSTQVFALFEQ